MKHSKRPLIVLAALVVASIAVIIGCTTANPNYNPNQPPSPSNQAFSVDPRLLSTSNTVAQVANTVAPLNPYAGITNYALSGIFGAIGLVSTVVARIKSGQAAGSQAVIDTMAAGAVKAGPQATQAILDHAATVSSAHVATIAAAISDNTGINQTATGIAKTG